MNTKILIVDDEAKIRAVVKEYAEFEGYEVKEACDGMEAVEKDIMFHKPKSKNESLFAHGLGVKKNYKEALARK